MTRTSLTLALFVLDIGRDRWLSYVGKGGRGSDGGSGGWDFDPACEGSIPADGNEVSIVVDSAFWYGEGDEDLVVPVFKSAVVSGSSSIWPSPVAVVEGLVCDSVIEWEDVDGVLLIVTGDPAADLSPRTSLR